MLANFIPVEFWYVAVIVLCVWFFLKATKTVVKVGLFIVAIFVITTYIIPHFGGV